MVRIRSHLIAYDKYVKDVPHDYLKFLVKANDKLKSKLANLRRQSKNHPLIDETLKLLVFVRKEISNSHLESKYKDFSI